MDETRVHYSMPERKTKTEIISRGRSFIPDIYWSIGSVGILLIFYTKTGTGVLDLQNTKFFVSLYSTQGERIYTVLLDVACLFFSFKK